MRKKALLCAVLVALVLAGSFTQASLQRSGVGSGASREEGEGAPGVNFLDFLGGVRQFMAYVLWIRTESLHHGYYGTLTLESELVPYYLMIGRLDPHNIDTYYAGGATIFYAGSEQEAIDFTLEGISNNPNNGDLYASLADLYLRQGENEKARDAFEEALSRQFEIVDAFFVTSGIAAASLAMGDTAGAVSALQLQLDDYRMALLREDLEQSEREFIVMKINLLEDEIGELRNGIADSVPGEEN